MLTTVECQMILRGQITLFLWANKTMCLPPDWSQILGYQIDKWFLTDKLLGVKILNLYPEWSLWITIQIQLCLCKENHRNTTLFRPSTWPCKRRNAKFRSKRLIWVTGTPWCRKTFWTQRNLFHAISAAMSPMVSKMISSSWLSS